MKIIALFRRFNEPFNHHIHLTRCQRHIACRFEIIEAVFQGGFHAISDIETASSNRAL